MATTENMTVWYDALAVAKTKEKVLALVKKTDKWVKMKLNDILEESTVIPSANNKAS